MKHFINFKKSNFVMEPMFYKYTNAGLVVLVLQP
jgi:hypothetical protein